MRDPGWTCMAVWRCLHVVRLLWIVLCQLRVGGHFLKVKEKDIQIFKEVKKWTMKMQIPNDLIAMNLICLSLLHWVVSNNLRRFTKMMVWISPCLIATGCCGYANTWIIMFATFLRNETPLHVYDSACSSSEDTPVGVSTPATIVVYIEYKKCWLVCS